MSSDVLLFLELSASYIFPEERPMFSTGSTQYGFRSFQIWICVLLPQDQCSGEVTPLPVEPMGPMRSKNMNELKWRESIFFYSLYMPWITHMLFFDLNDNFSCQEFDSLLCNCSIKGCRENTMRKTTCLVCAVTLPATGMDNTDNLPITETLHMPDL